MWPASPGELADAQRALAAARPAPWQPPATPAVGACYVCFARGQTGAGARGDRVWSAAAVLRGRHALAQADVTGEAGAPYVPGLLALREGPALEAAVRALPVMPDVLLVDATGADHPRRAGLALHLGAVLELPTIGVTHRPLLAGGAWPDDVRGRRPRCCSTTSPSARGCARAQEPGHWRCTPPGGPTSRWPLRWFSPRRAGTGRPSRCASRGGWRASRGRGGSRAFTTRSESPGSAGFRGRGAA